MPWWLTVFGLYVGGSYALFGGVVLSARHVARRCRKGGPMKARLEGGPFDGDTGDLVAPPGVPVTRPGELHTVRCMAGAACGRGGVHWWADEEVAREDAQRNHTSPYRYRFAREDGALVYVYAELTDGGRALLARALEPVPA